MLAEFLYLTTIGRRSGLPREIEIWYTERDGRYYVIAEYETSDWVQNLRANRRVSFRVADRQLSGTARLLDPQADPALHASIRALSEQKYGWGDGLIVELSPDQR